MNQDLKEMKKYLIECIDTTFVSSVGKFVDQFEGAIAKYTGAEHAVALLTVLISSCVEY